MVVPRVGQPGSMSLSQSRIPLLPPEQAPQVPGLIKVYGVTGHMEPSLEPLPSSGLPAPWAFQDPGWEGWIPNPHPTVDLGFVESSRCLNTSLYTLQFEILEATFPRPPG